MATATQHMNPKAIDFPPVFIKFTMSVERPIAIIAIVIKNLDNTFVNDINDSGIGKTVVKIENITKNKIKLGISFEIFNSLSELFFLFS